MPLYAKTTGTVIPNKAKIATTKDIYFIFQSFRLLSFQRECRASEGRREEPYTLVIYFSKGSAGSWSATAVPNRTQYKPDGHPHTHIEAELNRPSDYHATAEPTLLPFGIF